MYASSDFIALSGIMRFISPTAQGNARKKIKRPRSDEESDYGCIPAHFSFSKASLPSSTTREFSFRWRGEKTGEGEIQLDSDEHLCSMRFESPNALSGVFVSGLTGEIDFQGIKLGSVGPGRRRHTLHEAVCGSDRPCPTNAWLSRGYAAYESARVGRWG